MMRAFSASVLVWLLALRLTAGESLFDDDEVEAWKAKQAEGEPAGESLFDDDEIAAWKDKQGGDSDSEEAAENEVSFDSKTNSLTADIVFDERGNVKEGGNPDIAFYHVSEFNGERVDEPTHGSASLMEAIEKGEDYEVKFAPPSFSQFQCTEKVEGMHVILERYSHELSEELLERARKALADEGVTNSKQLGELDEKDYDEIRMPALVKSKLRVIRKEAKAQTEVAENKVEIDGEEVQKELREYMAARDQTRQGGDGKAEPAAAATGAADAATAAPAAAGAAEEEEEDGTFKSLVWAVLNCPTCKGKETIACFRTCRYEDPTKKKGWGECLDECIENRWLRATFRAMLPSDVKL